MSTRPPTAPDFEREIRRRWKNASSFVDVCSGDVHRKLGGYPGHSHNMPGCCQVMYRLMGPRDQVLRKPPKGKGATLVIRYRLPR